MTQTLVTGAAGFIGFHLASRLLEEGERVVGVDNLNPYYDVKLKEARLEKLRANPGFEFHRLDVADRDGMSELFSDVRPERVAHLAAQAGVRYSLEHPHSYQESNLAGFLNILEGCRHNHVGHLVFASSSSVYGANKRQPYSVTDNVDHPLSLYAATKKSNELMAHAYANLYDIPCTGLRFFTVYGPWGRPDMALFLFTRAILEGEAIELFNEGDMWRDFTYVDDVIEGCIRVLDHPPEEDDPDWSSEEPLPHTSFAPYRIYNIGRGEPVYLMKMVETLEEELGQVAEKEYLPMQPGDVHATHADVSQLRDAVGYEPSTDIADGIRRFVEWYLDYYEPS